MNELKTWLEMCLESARDHHECANDLVAEDKFLEAEAFRRKGILISNLASRINETMAKLEALEESLAKSQP